MAGHVSIVAARYGVVVVSVSIYIFTCLLKSKFIVVVANVCGLNSLY